MKVAHVRALLLASALIPASVLGAHHDVVRLASDEWCPYVCARDGKLEGGFVVEVTSRALAIMGYRVEPYLLPLNRAIQQAVGGTLDGVFAPPDKARLRSSSPLGYSRSCFYTNVKSTWRYQGIASLKGIRLGVIDDYEYDNGAADDYIRMQSNRNAIDFAYGANAGSINVKKLLGGRFDVLLEHELVMGRLIAALDAAPDLRNAGCLTQAFALRVGFAPKHSRSAQWSAALARGMETLEKSGELAQIRERYGIVRPEPVKAVRLPSQAPYAGSLTTKLLPMPGPSL